MISTFVPGSNEPMKPVTTQADAVSIVDDLIIRYADLRLDKGDRTALGQLREELRASGIQRGDLVLVLAAAIARMCGDPNSGAVQ